MSHIGELRGDGSSPPVYLGIDLAGVPHRETGIAVLRDSQLTELTRAGDDEGILALVRGAGPGVTVAVNAPLTRPRGRCCLDDDCPCRHDPGTRSRHAERELLRMRVPTLSTALLKVLARRGDRLAARLRDEGWPPLEVYPFASLRLLGLPTAGKRTALGRRRIHDALRPLVPGLNHPDASEHQLDAVVCALTARLWCRGLARTVGDPDEGLIVIPDAVASEQGWAYGAASVRRVAETGAAYFADPPPSASAMPSSSARPTGSA